MFKVGIFLSPVGETKPSDERRRLRFVKYLSLVLINTIITAFQRAARRLRRGRAAQRETLATLTMPSSTNIVTGL
jgi:hypothetical protein